MKSNDKKLKKFLYMVSPLFVVIVLLIVWQVIVKACDVPIWIFAPVDQTFVALYENIGEMLPDIWITLQEILIGYVGGVILGIVLAFIFTSSKILDLAISPYVLLLVVTPLIVVVPILMVYMGFGIEVKILATGIATFPIVLYNAQSGVRNVDPARYELMRSLRATKMQTFVKTLIPSALPSIFTGMRLACIFATISAISAEIAGSSTGLAPRMIAALGYSKLDLVLAYVLVMALIGGTLYYAIQAIEVKVLAWTKK